MPVPVTKIIMPGCGEVMVLSRTELLTNTGSAKLLVALTLAAVTLPDALKV
jgi:hypothetical protein